MTGFTGYTEFDNGLPPEGPEQMNGIFEHFDEKLAAPVSTASELPASGNWPGRSVFVEDTDSVYVWSGSAWMRTFQTPAAGSVNPVAGFVVNGETFLERQSDATVRGFVSITRSSDDLPSNANIAQISTNCRPTLPIDMPGTASEGSSSADAIMAKIGTDGFIRLYGLPAGARKCTFPVMWKTT